MSGTQIVTEDVLFNEMDGKQGRLGIIILNRPNVLNSLNQIMIQAMYAQLTIWRDAKDIKAVVIMAAGGRAFCAGGDLRATYERHQAQDKTLNDFFREEYELNKLIFHFPKPYIALLDGITMGGGVGISIHGSHRVATERLLFAMPETGIGFFPDVGGTYFLPRLPQQLGYYLGLTGARLTADECVALQLAQYKVVAGVLPELINALAAASLGEDAKKTVSDLLAAFSTPVDTTKIMLEWQKLNVHFAKPTVALMIESLAASDNAKERELAVILNKKSPTSLLVTHRAIARGATLEFDAVMQQEFQLAKHFLAGHDFMEGIRSLIIDKDQSPNWQPSTLSEVTESMIESYFK